MRAVVLLGLFCLFTLPFTVPIADAVSYSQNQLNTSLTEYNVTLEDYEATSEIVYIDIPRRANITTGNINLTRYNRTEFGFLDKSQDTSAYGITDMKICDNLNRIYLAGFTDSYVYELDLSWNLLNTYNVTELIPDANYPVNGQFKPSGITSDCVDDIWITDKGDLKGVYEFDTDFTFSGTNWTTTNCTGFGGTNTAPARIAMNDTDFFIVYTIPGSYQIVCVHDINGDFLYYNRTDNWGVTSIGGIEVDDDEIILLDERLAAHHAYVLNHDFTTKYNITLSNGCDDSIGYTKNDTYHLVADWVDDRIYMFSVGLPFPDVSVDVGNNGTSDFVNATDSDSELAEIADEINYYLQHTCTADWSDGVCSVPFNISSSGKGIVEITDINFSGYYLELFGDCDGNYYNDTAYFKFYDEENFNAVNGSAEYVITDVASGSSYNTSVSNIRNFAICSLGNSSYTVNMTMIFWNATSDQRSYYFYQATISNATADTINLLQIPSAASEKVEITVKDANDNDVKNAYVNIQRYYVDEDKYRTVVVGKTDTRGKFLTYLYPDTVFYKFVISLAGVVSNTEGPMVITDTTDDPELLDLYTAAGTTQFFDMMGEIGKSCYVNWTTNYTICTVADPSQLITSASLKVERMALSGYDTVCTDSDSGSAFTLSCYLGANPNGTYRYTLYGVLGSNPIYPFLSDVFAFPSPSEYGDFGLFITMMIFMVMVFLALVSAPLAIIFGIVGLGAGTILGFSEIGVGSLASLIIVGVIIMLKGRSS